MRVGRDLCARCSLPEGVLDVTGRSEIERIDGPAVVDEDGDGELDG